MFLAGCGINLPDVATYRPACSQFLGQGEVAPDNAIFFATSSLPDCRGAAMHFTPYRFTERTFGESLIAETGKAPWKKAASSKFSHADWLARLHARLYSGANDGKLLIFVHGYNSDYADALKKAWQLSRLETPGVPVVVVNWPSRDKWQGYSYDEASIEWAQDNLDGLLIELARESKDVTIVGHSLGTRAVVDAVAHFDIAAPELSARVSKVVLASPDIDRDRALRPGGLLEHMLGSPQRHVLVYASFADVAVRASRALHGYARLGSTNCLFDVDSARHARGKLGACHANRLGPRLAIVETGYVEAHGRIHHSDFVESCAVREDLRAFLHGGDTGQLREAIRTPDGTAYFISPALVAKAGFCREKPR